MKGLGPGNRLCSNLVFIILLILNALPIGLDHSFNFINGRIYTSVFTQFPNYTQNVHNLDYLSSKIVKPVTFRREICIPNAISSSKPFIFLFSPKQYSKNYAMASH